jgi:hypothetical protein
MRLKDGSIKLTVSFLPGTSMATLEALGDTVEVRAPEVGVQADPVSMEALRGIVASATAMLDVLIVNANTPVYPMPDIGVHEEEQFSLSAEVNDEKQADLLCPIKEED